MYNHKTGISLRKIEQIDLVDLQNLKSNWWGTHKTLIVNSEDQDRWFRSIPSNELVMIASNKEGEIGVAVYSNIDWIARTLSVSGSIYPIQKWSKCAYEQPKSSSAFAAGLDFAFEILNTYRVEAEVVEYHHPAQKLEIDYLGFTVEGRKRKSVYKCGRYYDSLILGLLREDWMQQERVKSYGSSCNTDFDHNLAEKLIKRLSASATDQL